MGRVHQPLLLLVTFLVAFSALIEGRTTAFKQIDLQKVRSESEGFKDPNVDSPFNSVYYPHSSGVPRAKKGSTRVIGENPALFLFGFPFPFPFPLPLPLPGLGLGLGGFPFPLPLPFPQPGWWGGRGFPGGFGKGRGGGFPGGPGNNLAEHTAEGKDEFRRNPYP